MHMNQWISKRIEKTLPRKFTDLWMHWHESLQLIQGTLSAKLYLHHSLFFWKLIEIYREKRKKNKSKGGKGPSQLRARIRHMGLAWRKTKITCKPINKKEAKTFFCQWVCLEIGSPKHMREWHLPAIEKMLQLM